MTWPDLVRLLGVVAALLGLQMLVESGALGSWSWAVASFGASTSLVAVALWWGEPEERRTALAGALILTAGLFLPLPVVESAEWRQMLMPSAMTSLAMLSILIFERSPRLPFLGASLLVALANAVATIT